MEALICVFTHLYIYIIIFLTQLFSQVMGNKTQKKLFNPNLNSCCYIESIYIKKAQLLNRGMAVAQ